MASCSLQAHPQTYTEQIAISLEQQGKTAEAEDAWRGLSKSQPANPLPFAHLGLLEARQEHYPQAIEFYRRAVGLDAKMPGLRLNLGLAYFKDGNYKEAIEIFAPLLKAEPADSQESYRLAVLLGMSHYGLGEYAAAVPLLRQASANDPQNLNLLLTLAHSCLLSNQYPCVLDVFHQMVALNADSAEADMLVGEALDEMKDPIGATREFRAAILANPKQPNVHFGLGYLLWTKGQYPEAAPQFQAEVDNNPRHFQAMLYLADSYIQMNNMEDARPLLERLVALNPSDSMEHRDLGIVYADKGMNDDALREFRSAETLKPGDVNVHWRLGRLYRSMGNTAAAKAEFEKASSLNKAEDDRLLKVMSAIPDTDAHAQQQPKISVP